MTKAVLLSSCCDPFISLLVLKLWQERWHNEVDAFYINYNNHCSVPQWVMQELCSRSLADEKVTLVCHPKGIGNGPPITELLQICKEDLILLLEDDFFIFESGAVKEQFEKIENGECDIVGSPRYSHGEVAEAAKKKYNLDYSGYGDNGFGWWPAGFYCKRKDLLKTDLDFGSKAYLKNKYFKELDHTFEADNYTDTFTWASIQLRYLGLKSVDIPQNHADPYEALSKETGEMNWRKPMKWIHGGSLSAGIGGYLSGSIPDVSHEAAKLEMETRCAFWIIASDVISGFDEFKVEYRKGIENLIVKAKLDVGRIKQKHNIYKELMKL